MKRILQMGVLLALALSLLAGCASRSGVQVKEYAAGDQLVGEDQTAVMRVELTGGYSVAFASGAAYLYKGEPSDENDVAAHGFVITKEEYDEEIGYLTTTDSTKDDVKDLGDGVYSYENEYYFPTEDGFFMKVVVQEGALDEAASIYPRFSAYKTDF